MASKELINRLNRLQGQIDAVKTSIIEEEHDCVKVITLTKAVQGALKKFAEAYVLQDMEYCLTTEKLSKKDIEKKLKELIESSFRL